MTENNKNLSTMGNIVISIIIPAKNEGECLGRCLESIKSAKHEAPYEIIVVDNNSTDNTEEIAKSYNCKVIKNSRPGPAATRNAGAEVAKGDFIAFIDADCILPVEWFLFTKNQMRENDNIVAIGTKISPDIHDTTWVENTLHRLSQRRGVNVYGNMRKVRWIGTSNILLKKKLFRSIGGFDETLLSCEDYDLCEKLSKFGDIHLEQRITTTHLRGSKKLIELFGREQIRGQNSLSHWIKGGFSAYEAPSVIIPFVFILCTALGGIILFFNPKWGTVLLLLGVGIAVIRVLRVQDAWRDPLLLIRGVIVSWVYCLARGVALIKDAFNFLSYKL